MLTPWLCCLGFLFVSFLRLRRLLGVLTVHTLPSVTAPIQHPATVLFSHPVTPKAERPARSLDVQPEPRGFRLMPRFRSFHGITFDRHLAQPLVCALTCCYLFLPTPPPSRLIHLSIKFSDLSYILFYVEKLATCRNEWDNFFPL